MMRARIVVACAFAACALLAGCQSNTQGTPVTPSAQPTEPSFPTPRPTTSRPAPSTTTTTTQAAPTASAAPPAGQVLPPDDSGYVFVQTKSGKTRCQLNRQQVDCEAPFTNTPIQNGIRANGVTVTADGSMRFVVGNLGDIPAQTLDYRTYSAVGWTIEATADGTRFTNDATRHGMFVSVEKVTAF